MKILATISLALALAAPAFAQHEGHNADPNWGVKVPPDEEKVQAKIWKEVFDQITEIQNARAPGTRQSLNEQLAWMALNEATEARKAKDGAAFSAAIKRALTAIARVQR